MRERESERKRKRKREREKGVRVNWREKGDKERVIERERE